MKNPEHILQEIKMAYCSILKANLVGIYVHGSLAFDCFHWEMSDIDYIVAVNKPLTTDEKQRIMAKTIFINSYAPSKGLEMSVVLKKHCLNFIYPTPYELHFSNIHLEQYRSSAQKDCRIMGGANMFSTNSETGQAKQLPHQNT